MRIALISNAVFEPYLVPALRSRFDKKTEIIPIPHLEIDEYAAELASADLTVFWLNFEELYPDILRQIRFGKITAQEAEIAIVSYCETLYGKASAHTNNSVLWFSFEDYYAKTASFTGHIYGGFVDRLNLALAEKLGANTMGNGANFRENGAVFIDTKRLIAEVGVANAYDPKGKYRWNAPYSKALIELAAGEIYKHFLIERGVTKKCLVLDCDGVLWGGVLAEDGVENLKLGGSGLGRSHQDFQRFVLELYNRGVILAICSKNDLSDVLSVLRAHSETLLREEHFACIEANWESKIDNIRKIAETLNIGLDSIVFVDDSPHEIEAVRGGLPEVTAVLYERDSVYERLSCFNLRNTVDLSDVERRNETYRSNRLRAELEAESATRSDYITALEIKLDIHEAIPVEFARISELTQRTNKRTNGTRRSVAQVKEKAENPCFKLYSVSVADRFSDLGLVGAVAVEASADGEVLTLFALSCRALGRGIEDKMLGFIAQKHKIASIEAISTGKNDELLELLKERFPPC